jgi:hypothetical protein
MELPQICAKSAKLRTGKHDVTVFKAGSILPAIFVRYLHGFSAFHFYPSELFNIYLAFIWPTVMEPYESILVFYIARDKVGLSSQL